MEIPALDPATSSGGYVYDVTLSWNSEGAKQPFVDTLYEALVRSGLRTFKDDDISKLDVQKAREQSMISIIILSEDLSDSPTVVQELETIIECSSRSKYLVLPVFYDVNPYKRSDKMIYNEAAPTSMNKQQLGQGISDLMSFVYDVNPYKRSDKMIYNEAAPTSRNKQQLGQGISDLMSFVLRKDTDINEQKIIQSFVGFIQEGLKTNKISSWGNKVCQLMDSGLSKLPINMKFPILKELFLQDNKYLLAIPTSFFEFMPSLQVLDMSRTSIKQLPPSISNLVYLQKLFLRDCALLMKLPPEIQDLKNLEIFDLSGTELIYIPEEIKNLCKLECLRMSLSASADEYILEINENMEVNKKIEIIPKNTLSKLSNLKELSIFVDLNCKWWGVIVESIILDLGSLEKLEILKLYFPTVYLLQRLLQLQKVCQSLSDFRLVVGRGDQRVISRYFPQELKDEFETLEKGLKYVNGREDINEVSKACEYARTLFVDRHWTIDTLSIIKNSIENIRFCVLVECNKLENVINGHDLYLEGDNEDKFNVEKPVFGLLQYLSIHYMKNLKSIWVGPFPRGSLKKLQILALNACPNLDTILDVKLLRNLLSLKELIVEDCPKLESLVSVESSYLEYWEEFLPSLERLTLLYLPKLDSISRGLRIAPRLARMVVYGCPKLQTLSPMEVNSKHIKEIKGESEWWKTLQIKSDQHDVFVPLEGDGLMNQLAEARTSHNTLSTIQNSDANQIQSRKAGDIAMFSCGLELASMMVNSGLLKKACSAICDTPVSFNDQDPPFSISIHVTETLDNNGKIIAFRSSLNCTAQNLEEEEGKDLMPSTGTFFDFIATKQNPSISINKVAVQVFVSLFEDHLSALRDQIDISKQLVVTGNSLGGSIASLFTLWLLDTVYLNSKPNPPLCITFGSPLLGDSNFHKAIYQRSSWPSCFMHVALSRDPIPKLFVSLDSLAYMPFGSFLFCSESGCACFNEPESVLEVMVAMRLDSVGDLDLSGIQIEYYRRVLVNLESNVKYKGISELGDLDFSPLRGGIVLELEAAGLIQTQEEENDDTRTLMELVKKMKENDLIRKRYKENDLIGKRYKVDSKKKLNEIKISMAYLEWYKKLAVDDGGYYDAYKKPNTTDKRKSRGRIKTEKAKLDMYWKRMVKEAEQMPQKELLSFRTSWLYAGTNYRRMVEPLEIADYYLSGKTDYIRSARPHHFIMMEKWFNDDKKPQTQTSSSGERKQPASLTEDSCFWAHVEEAVISLKLLTQINSNPYADLVVHKLIDFEDYVEDLMKNYLVSPEVFLEKSTFMEWWEECKQYKERTAKYPYSSALADIKTIQAYNTSRAMYGFNSDFLCLVN